MTRAEVDKRCKSCASFHGRHKSCYLGFVPIQGGYIPGGNPVTVDGYITTCEYFGKDNYVRKVPKYVIDSIDI